MWLQSAAACLHPSDGQRHKPAAAKPGASQPFIRYAKWPSRGVINSHVSVVINERVLHKTFERRIPMKYKHRLTLIVLSVIASSPSVVFAQVNQNANLQALRTPIVGPHVNIGPTPQQPFSSPN